MDTFLDLLIVVVMGLVATGLLAVLGMFLIRNRTVKRVCFYVVSTLGLYIGYVGVRILGIGFAGQALLALLMASVCVAAIVLSFVKKDNQKIFLAARIASSVALMVGMFNAFAW